MKVTWYGIKEILVSAILLCGASAVLIYLSIQYDALWLLTPVALLILVFGWVLWFFRDPSRTIPTMPGIIVSPADGTVTHIDNAEEPDFIDGNALRCSIFRFFGRICG